MLWGNESTMPQTLPQPEKRTFLVVDDHARVLGGTLNILKQEYPQAEILTAPTAQAALQQIAQTTWMQMLQFAFQESLQDTAIAKRMNVSERTVQYYWTKIRDVLEVYPDDDKNLRIQTEVRAREEGLID